MLISVIVGCEVGFWLLLGAALSARYLLRWPRVSAVLLVCVPMVDLVLLAATVVDLRSGATATAAHGLAAVYLGSSVAFGHSMVRWADQRFAHRFAGGPPPVKPPRSGWAKARHEWREYGKGVLGAAVTCGLLVAAIVAVGDDSRTAALQGWLPKIVLAMLVWLVALPIWETVRAGLAASTAAR
jgi:hypothetical protein